MANPAPGFRQVPRSHIVTRRADKRVRVMVNGQAIADSRGAIELQEGNYPVAYYLPRLDVRMGRLARTSHSTHCPFKGDASYFSIMDGPETAVWSYERPYDEMADIKDLLAFYPNKVDSITVSDE